MSHHLLSEEKAKPWCNSYQNVCLQDYPLFVAQSSRNHQNCHPGVLHFVVQVARPRFVMMDSEFRSYQNYHRFLYFLRFVFADRC